MSSWISGDACGIDDCDRPVFKDELCSAHYRLAAMTGALSAAARTKPVPWESALVLIETLAKTVDDLAEGLEDFMDSVETEHNMEPLMLRTLTLTNTARRFVAEHG